jgi:hypothetical protein
MALCWTVSGWKTWVRVRDTLIERALKTEHARGNEQPRYALYTGSGFKPNLRLRAAADLSLPFHMPKSMLSDPRG